MADTPCEAQVKVEGLLSISTPACVLPHLDSPTITISGEAGAATPAEPLTNHGITVNMKGCPPKWADMCRHDIEGDPECCGPVYTSDGKITHYEWMEPIFDPGLGPH